MKSLTLKELSNPNCNRATPELLKKLGYNITIDEKINKFIANKNETQEDEPNFIELIFGNRIEYKIWTKNNLRHRIDKPAVYYYLDGNILISCEYYYYDINYNSKSFSSLEFYSNGQLKYINWTNKDGQYHNEKGNPSIIKLEKNKTIKKTWYNNGILENPILYKPTSITIKSNKIIDYSFFIRGIPITEKVIKWTKDNNIDILNINNNEGKMFLMYFEQFL